MGIKLKQGNEYQLAVEIFVALRIRLFPICQFSISARGCAKENRNDEGNDIARLFYITYHYIKIAFE